MPPIDYLTATGIETCLQYLASTYPSICKLTIMPEKSVEGRTIRAIKLAKGTGANRRAVLFLGGVHARELVNPDLLVTLALKLCKAYTEGTGLTFGGKSFKASTIRLLINAMDIFFLPLVNPDGRVFVQSATGDRWWRKNRSPIKPVVDSDVRMLVQPAVGDQNTILSCKGVDINRNFDFLHSSGIGTSSNWCSDTFKGSGAFSEPETRNVRYMLDTFPNILGMVDVHSFSELILHPWGDDTNQLNDSTKNFLNPAFDGLRGNTNDTTYMEFIPRTDLDFFVKTANKMRDTTAAVRGRVYTVKQSAFVYTTGVTGTSEDYAYSRNFVNATKRKVFAFTYETGREFQPLIPEAQNIMLEVSAGLIEFCNACLCVVEETLTATSLAADLDDMRAFRDNEMLATAAGRKYVELLEDNGIELMQMMVDDEKLRKQAIELAGQVHEVVKSRKASKPKVFSAKITTAAENLLRNFESKGSPELKKAIKIVQDDLKYFQGKTVLEGLKSV